SRVRFTRSFFIARWTLPDEFKLWPTGRVPLRHLFAATETVLRIGVPHRRALPCQSVQRATVLAPVIAVGLFRVKVSHTSTTGLVVSPSTAAIETLVDAPLSIRPASAARRCAREESFLSMPSSASLEAECGTRPAPH